MQLQFVRDQWDHYFAFQMSERVVHAVKLILSFQTQSLYRPYAVSLPYERGAEMIMPLLITFGATEGEVRRANAITAVLNGQHEPAPTNLTPIQVEDAMELTAPSFSGKHSSENESGSQDEGCDRGMCAPAGLSHEGGEAREPSVDGSSNAPSPIAFDSTMGSSLPTLASKTAVKKDSKELRAAKCCLELADYEEAVYWIDKELVRTKRKPHTHARLLVMRSHCWFELKQPQKAYDDAREALATETKSVGACGGVSTSLVKLERLSEAHSMCSAGRSIDPTNKPSKPLENEISLKAFEASQQVTEASPSGSSDHSEDKTHDQQHKWKVALKVAVSLVQKSDFVAAEAAFTEALTLAGDGDLAVGTRMKLLGHRSRCRVATDQFLLAIEDAGEGLKLKSDWLDGHRLVCRGLFGLQRWDEASHECDIVLKGCPQDVAFRNLMDKIGGQALPQLFFEIPF